MVMQKMGNRSFQTEPQGDGTFDIIQVDGVFTAIQGGTLPPGATLVESGLPADIAQRKSVKYNDSSPPPSGNVAPAPSIPGMGTMGQGPVSEGNPGLNRSALAGQGQGMQPAQEGSDILRERQKERLAQQAFTNRTASTSRDEEQAQMNMRVGQGDLGVQGTGPPMEQEIPTYGAEIFGDTWAADAGTDDYRMQNIISGKMTPDAAVQNMLDSQGFSSYGNRQLLEDTYANYGALYGMTNPGLSSPDPAEYYGQGGDFTMGLMQPSDGQTMVNAPQLWDNQFSDEYVERNAIAAQAGGSNPELMERDLILQNIIALTPYMGEDNQAFLESKVYNAHTEYMANGMNATMSFTDYLRQVGAEEWI